MKKKYWFITIAAASAAAASAVSVANIEAYAPLPYTIESSSARLQEFCDRYWGMISRDLSVCRFEHTHYFSISRIRGEIAQTGIAVITGDLIRFDASDGAVPFVGTRQYVADSPEFKASSDGYLSFRSPNGPGILILRKVKQLRCFRQDGRLIRSTQCEE